MSKLMKEKLKELTGIKDIASAEYKDISEVSEISDVDLRFSRGSVRLVLGKVILPSDIKNKFKYMLEHKLPGM